MYASIANEANTYIKIYTFMVTVLLFQDGYQEGLLQLAVAELSLLFPQPREIINRAIGLGDYRRAATYALP